LQEATNIHIASEVQKHWYNNIILFHGDLLDLSDIYHPLQLIFKHFITIGKQERNNNGDPEESSRMLDIPEPNDERSYSRAQHALRTERFVVIFGIQGAGKTFLAIRLCDGQDCHWITEPDAFPADPEYGAYFVIDDVFHELQTEDQVRGVKSKMNDLYENVVVKG
jgi:hypothetical protein